MDASGRLFAGLSKDLYVLEHNLFLFALDILTSIANNNYIYCLPKRRKQCP